jgi:hypothetical protein
MSDQASMIGDDVIGGTDEMGDDTLPMAMVTTERDGTPVENPSGG